MLFHEAICDFVMVVHTCNLNSQEAEAGGLRIPDQCGLHHKVLSQNPQMQDIPTLSNSAPSP